MLCRPAVSARRGRLHPPHPEHAGPCYSEHVNAPPSAEKTPPTRWAAVTDRVPTGWIITGCSALLLAVSAAFGGLADAAADPVPALAPGTEIAAAPVLVRVENAVLVDELAEASLPAENGVRYLVVAVTAENTHSGPLASLPEVGLPGTLRVTGAGLDGDADPVRVVRLDDGTLDPVLQPGVPARVAVVWQINDDPLDTVTVHLRSRSYAAGGFVTAGGRFEKASTVATVELAVPRPEPRI